MFQKIAKHRANDASNDVHRPPLAKGGRGSLHWHKATLCKFNRLNLNRNFQTIWVGEKRYTKIYVQVICAIFITSEQGFLSDIPIWNGEASSNSNQSFYTQGREKY